jgi:hypothetical protein
VNKTIREKLRRAKRKIERRLSRVIESADTPVLGTSKVDYEVHARVQATNAGGLGLVHELVRHLGLPRAINDRVTALKRHVPYHESDHVLSLAYNLLAGGTCIEDLELRRKDSAFLDLLGAERIPDPTTAGDFCRRFTTKESVDTLQDVFNESRLRVWQEQPASFFDQALLDVDGTIAETTGEKKEGMDISHKGSWGYQVLVVSLANTQEVLSLDSRPGSRPSHEGAADRIDQSITLLRRAGFRRITVRGDTDYSQTQHLDGWDKGSVEFVFGYDAHENLCQIAQSLPNSAWSDLERKNRYEIKTEPRLKRPNVKQEIVCQRELLNLHLLKETVAEFDYQPRACAKAYRMVVVRKLITHERGEAVLFRELRYFFYITNNRNLTRQEIVELANKRAGQERLIDQLKNGVHALRMPLDNLHSNWAYAVIATLAWNLSRWLGLLLPEKGRWKEQHGEDKNAVRRMTFSTFIQALILIPAQVVATGRRLIVRLLGWNPWQIVFFRALDAVRRLA